MKSDEASLLSNLNQHQITHRRKAIKCLSVLIKAINLLKEVHQVPGTCQGEKKCAIPFPPRRVGIKSLQLILLVKARE